METVREIIGIVSYFVLPTMLVGFPVYGLIKGVKVYEVFVEGAKEGFEVAVMIIPYLVAILFAFPWPSSVRSPAAARPGSCST